MKTLYVGAGGFWTLEAIYRRIKGVEEVVPGYMGGTVSYPTHEAVSTGTTGHAEVIKIVHDESMISTEALLKVFYALHDSSAQQHPSLGIGSQYRSVIFYTEDSLGEAQDPENGENIGLITRIAEEMQAELPEEASFSTHIMTAGEFYPAEEYHYDFYGKNRNSGYATEVILPALEKVRSQFPSLFLD